MRFSVLKQHAGPWLLPVLMILPAAVLGMVGAPPTVWCLRLFACLCVGVWLEWGVRAWRGKRTRIFAAGIAALCAAVPVLMEAAGYLLTGNGLDVRFFYHLTPATFRFGTGGYEWHLAGAAALTAVIAAAAMLRTALPRTGTIRSRRLLPLLPVCWLAASPLTVLLCLMTPRPAPSGTDPAGYGIKMPPVDRYRLKAEPGRNLIVIYLESIENTYLDEREFPGLLPNIRRFMAQEAVTFTDILPARNADFTLGGIYSSLSGSIFLDRHLLGIRRAASLGNNGYDVTLGNRLVSLPEILHCAGYRQSILVGVDPHFAGMNVMAHQMRIDEIVSGRRLLELAGLAPDVRSVSQWGVRDRALFRAGLRLAAERLKSGRPFALYLVTVDAHHPNGFPDPEGPVYSGRGKPELPLLNAIHADDRMLGEFVAAFRGLSGSANTVIAVMTDHPAMRNSVSGILERNPRRGLIAFALNAGPARLIATPGRTFDMAPTWAALLGIRHNSGFLLGEDLLADAVSPRRLFGDRREAEPLLYEVLKRCSDPPCVMPPGVSVTASPFPALTIGRTSVPLFREWGVQQFPCDGEGFAVRLSRAGELRDFRYCTRPALLKEYIASPDPEGSEWVILAGVNAVDALLPEASLKTDGFYLMRGGPGRWELRHAPDPRELRFPEGGR